MSGQLLQPPELSAQVPEAATPQQCVAMWIDLMKTCDQFLMAGLRREVGPDGDLEEAYRRWYAEAMADHDRTVARMLAEAKRREMQHDDATDS